MENENLYEYSMDLNNRAIELEELILSIGSAGGELFDATMEELDEIYKEMEDLGIDEEDF